MPTAFVLADTNGRELDVHVIEIGRSGTIIQHYDNPWSFPHPISEHGSIGGTAVTCVSKETYLAMHAGYTLPDGQIRDFELLQSDS